VAQLSIYDTLCSSKNDARRTEADFDLSRFMLCVVGLSKSRQKDDSSGLPTIGKPRNGDSKTPCLTMLAKKQKSKKAKTKQNSKSFAPASPRDFFTACHPQMMLLKQVLQSVFTSVQDQRPALEHRRFQREAAAEWLHAGPWRLRCWETERRRVRHSACSLSRLATRSRLRPFSRCFFGCVQPASGPSFRAATCPSNLIVCVVLVSLVLVGVPVGESVDHVCDGVEVCEGEAGLGFLWWEIVRCVVAEGFDELEQILADTVVGVVRRRAIAQRKRLAEVMFVLLEDGEGGLDRGSGCLCHNGLPDVGTLVADILDQVAKLVGREGLEEARKRQRTACGCVCAGALDGAVLVREAAVLQRW
jgi:hypothetical protein